MPAEHRRRRIPIPTQTRKQLLAGASRQSGSRPSRRASRQPSSSSSATPLPACPSPAPSPTCTPRAAAPRFPRGSASRPAAHAPPPAAPARAQGNSASPPSACGSREPPGAACHPRRAAAATARPLASVVSTARRPGSNMRSTGAEERARVSACLAPLRRRRPREPRRGAAAPRPANTAPRRVGPRARGRPPRTDGSPSPDPRRAAPPRTTSCLSRVRVGRGGHRRAPRRRRPLDHRLRLACAELANSHFRNSLRGRKSSSATSSRCCPSSVAECTRHSSMDTKAHRRTAPAGPTHLERRNASADRLRCTQRDGQGLTHAAHPERPRPLKQPRPL